MLLTISPASHASTVICRSDSLRTRTAANVYAYEIALEQNKVTGSTTETKRTSSVNATERSAMQTQQPTSEALRIAAIMSERQESQPVKALQNYAGFDLRHSCYLSILV